MSFARIRITWPGGEVIANLEETPTARSLVAALPIHSSARTWGEEVYFEAQAPIKLEREARQIVEPGTVCYWVEGGSLALPWGRTPMSEGGESRLVSRCNVLGHIDGDPRELASVNSGDAVTVTLE